MKTPVAPPDNHQQGAFYMNICSAAFRAPAGARPPTVYVTSKRDWSHPHESIPAPSVKPLWALKVQPLNDVAGTFRVVAYLLGLGLRALDAHLLQEHLRALLLCFHVLHLKL